VCRGFVPLRRICLCVPLHAGPVDALRGVRGAGRQSCTIMVAFGPRLLLLVASLFLQAPGQMWFEEARELRSSDSVRIRAIPAMSTVAWGGGAAGDPVGMRGVEYQYQTKQPYEWYLKFNLDTYKDRHINSAVLGVSKCAASSSCSTHCKSQSKCTCATIFYIADASCGGGNIVESYSEGSDDLNVWHTSNNWNTHWKFEDWRHTFSQETRDGVESTAHGTGGEKKLSFANYVGGVQKVGEFGTAKIDVVDAIGVRDGHVAGQRYKVRGGYVSLRLTVNGTNSRFFVPPGGDVNFIPTLRLGLTYTTTTTGPPTTTTTVTTTSVTTTSGNSTTAGPTTTATTTSGPATTTTTSTTMPALSEREGGLEGLSMLEATTTTTTATTTAVGVAGAGPSWWWSSGAGDVRVMQVFSIKTSSGRRLSTSKLSASELERVALASFHSSCQTSIALAMGRLTTDVKVLGARASPDSFKITVRYQVSAHSYNEMNSTIAASQTCEFAEVFGQRLIAAEQAVQQGLRISEVTLGRESAVSAAILSDVLPSPNRTALGKVLNIYADPVWGIVRYEDWASRAVPAIKAAVVKTLGALTPWIPASRLAICVTNGPVVFDSMYSASNVQISMYIHAAVPQFPQIGDDPGGNKYALRVQTFEVMLANMHHEPEFQALVRQELTAEGLPLLPSMFFEPGSYAKAAVSAGSAASGGVVAAVLFPLLLMIVSCGLCIQLRRKPELRDRVAQSRAGRACVCVCPCLRPVCICICPRRQPLSPADIQNDEEIIRVESSKVESFSGEDEVLHCICGSRMSPEDTACRHCGRKLADIAHELYVESRADAELRGASGEFDQPRSPSGTEGKFSILKLVGDGTKGLFDMSKVASELDSKRTQSPRPGGDGSPKRRHKYLGDENSTIRPALHKQANSLRMAMGGSAHTHTMSQSSTTTTTMTTKATMSDSATSSSQRMVESLRNYNSLGTATPDQSPTKMGTSLAPFGVGRPESRGTNSTSGSEEMEVIEVTDSSSDED